MGLEADWKAVDAAFVQAAAIARDVAKYRHAQLSAVSHTPPRSTMSGRTPQLEGEARFERRAEGLVCEINLRA
jgi:hypothetical protein